MKSDNDNKQESKKARKTRVRQSEVPRISLTEALKVAQAINDDFAKDATKPLNVAFALDTTPGSGDFRNLLGSSSAYGFNRR